MAGVLAGLFGLGYLVGIHSAYYFFAMQIIAGLFQSTGWPAVVAVFASWFGKVGEGVEG